MCNSIVDPDTCMSLYSTDQVHMPNSSNGSMCVSVGNIISINTCLEYDTVLYEYYKILLRTVQYYSLLLLATIVAIVYHHRSVRGVPQSV